MTTTTKKKERPTLVGVRDACVCACHVASRLVAASLLDDLDHLVDGEAELLGKLDGLEEVGALGKVGVAGEDPAVDDGVQALRVCVRSYIVRGKLIEGRLIGARHSEGVFRNGRELVLPMC